MAQYKGDRMITKAVLVLGSGLALKGLLVFFEVLATTQTSLEVILK